VDPDNRRPVDFKTRKAYLEEIMEREEKDMSGLISELLYLARDGRVKMFLIHRALKARRVLPELFLQGDYLPLYAQGSKKKNIIAFARRFKEDNGIWALTVAPRITTDLVDIGGYPLGTDVWRDTFLAMPKGTPEQWVNALTGEKTILESNVEASQGDDRKKAQEGIDAEGRLLLGKALSKFPVALLLAGDVI
jgi:(1->4)-alpha-D-glucan 1-alpha-D-glucosylmutase